MPRLPFVPWIFTHAARLEQVPVRRMYADPTQYTKCLQNARKLYGYDAIAGSFDSSLELEICGCHLAWRGEYETPAANPLPGFDFDRLRDIDIESAGKTGRFGTVIESLRRFKMVSGQDLALAAVVSGPLTLTAGLTGDDPLRDFAEKPEEVIRAIEAAAGFLLKVVQVYCQLELDIIAVAERPLALAPPALLASLQSAFSPVVNTIRFFNAFSVLLPGESPLANLAGLADLGFDGIVAAGIDMNAWNKIKGGRSGILGQAVPSRLFAADLKELRAYLEAYPPLKDPGVFLTTDGEVPPDTPPDNIRYVMETISKG